MVKKTNENSVTVEDIMKKQLSLLESGDRLSKLEKESIRDKKIIQELKEREKVSARALILFERKFKFLKETYTGELLKLCKLTAETDESFSSQDFIDILEEANEKLYTLLNKTAEATTLSADDRAFILNKQLVEPKKEDTQARFDRLKASFNQKIGESVMRKPGRPKKQDQSIVADIGLGKKVENVIDKSSDTKHRLEELFYGMPTAKTTISTIPQTDDAAFDFAEALNPNESLKDIMSDIMNDLASDEEVVYNKQNIDKFISKIDKNQANELENGVIKKPKIKNFSEQPSSEKPAANRGHKNGILTANELFDDIKK